MKIFIVIASLLFCQKTYTQDQIFSLGHLAPNINHTGKVWLNHLSKADEYFDYNIAIAKFDKGAKLNWHKHPKGQKLIIIEGTGYYQERNQPIQIVTKGDIITSMPNTEHWHSATQNTGVTYLAITGNQKTHWLEKVTNEEFNSINYDSLSTTNQKNEIKKLSKLKWELMAEKNILKLDEIFHKQSKFIHMGGSWGKDRELEIIESGGIHYKHPEIHSVEVDVINDSAILINEVTLLAMVGGKEVTNKFMVSESYIRENETWKLSLLSFTKLIQE